MPPLAYALARRLLFSLDPEVAHNLTLRSLALAHGTPLQWSYDADRVEDPIMLAGLTFPNRVGLAAGLDKNANCIDGLGALGFGFMELGTVTPVAQAGNPKPRMFRLTVSQALINRLGFNNAGLETFTANLQRSDWYRQRQQKAAVTIQPMLLGLNIGKNANTPMENASDDYLRGLDAIYPYADYVSINISSPNTRDLRSLQDDAALDALLGALAQRRETLAQQHRKTARTGKDEPHRVPIFIKIAPDLERPQVKAIAAALQRHNMDGVIATNTTLRRESVQGQTYANEAGGLSGAPLLALSNHVIRQLRDALGPTFPIIGVGGIMSGEDAVSKIKAGADVVQLYTGLIYQGPRLVGDCATLIRQTC